MRIRIEGAVTGPQVARELCRLLDQHPETAGYDALYDLTRYAGSVGHADLAPVRPVYERARRPSAGPARSAFITSDPAFQYWAAALDHQFPGRQHAAFPDEVAAEAYLRTPVRERA